jgi:hypothetical protein
MFILSYEAGFYKSTILKVHPPISGITAHATMPGRLKHSIFSFCSRLLIQNEWCLKNGLHQLSIYVFKNFQDSFGTKVIDVLVIPGTAQNV